METLSELPSTPLKCRYPLFGLLQRSLLSDKRLLKRLELEELALDLKVDITEPLDPLLSATLRTALFSRLLPVRGGGGHEQPAEEEHRTR